ncbi:hypothetical protein HYS94_02185 [Candidatus Daviesbacteria bacterium]|nr:hypothetical protein [Candidatus Daviesbacteria bacterium]
MPDINSEILDTLKSLQKSNEGTMLGLAAISEVIQKNNEYFAKQAEYDEMEEEEAKNKEEEEMEKKGMDDLTKAVSEAVMKQVRDMMANAPHQVGGKAGWPVKGGGEDDAKTVTPRTAENEVQKPIQAQDMASKVEDKDKEEYPKEEDEHKDLIEKSALAKELMELKKSFEDYKNGIDSRVEKEVTARLGKLGFHEDKSLIAPKVSAKSLGTNVDVPITKTADGDVTDEMAKLPWAVLKNMEVKIMKGDTDGVPQEILRKMS